MESIPLREVLHKYSRTQLVLISHGSSINAERSRIAGEIKYEENRSRFGDNEPPKSFAMAEGGEYQVGEFNRGPKRGEKSAEEYREFMGWQGIKFRKVK